MDSAQGLRRLAESFSRHLRAENKSQKTVEAYGEAVRQLMSTAIEAEHVQELMIRILKDRRAATAHCRFRALQQFFKWLELEGHVPSNPMARLRPPILPEEPPPVVAEQDLHRVLATCNGRLFNDVRDSAIIRLLADSGPRRAELLGLRVGDVDLDARVVSVLGKGRRPRSLRFGRKTAKALDRYDVARGKHPYAYLESYWLSRRGTLTESGLALMLKTPS